MDESHSRWVSFEAFVCGREGSALYHRIHAMARHHLNRHAVKIDPNWRRAEIIFDQNQYYPGEKMSKLPLTDIGACRAELDYRPTSVLMSGPKSGNVELSAEIFGMIPESLIAFMRLFDIFKPWPHVLYNPRHQIELIDGKTVIEFENGEEGVVRNVRGDEFDVEIFDSVFGTPPNDGAVMHYTRDQLMAEMAMDAFECQAVGVDYLPYVGTNGVRLETAEDVRAARR